MQLFILTHKKYKCYVKLKFSETIPCLSQLLVLVLQRLPASVQALPHVLQLVHDPGTGGTCSRVLHRSLRLRGGRRRLTSQGWYRRRVCPEGCRLLRLRGPVSRLLVPLPPVSPTAVSTWSPPLRLFPQIFLSLLPVHFLLQLYLTFGKLLLSLQFLKVINKCKI